MSSKKSVGKSSPSIENPHSAGKIHDPAGSIARAPIIKDEDVFFVSRQSGAVPLRNRQGYGLYYHDCRYLNGYEIKLAGENLEPLVASALHGFLARFELTNPQLQLPGGTVLKKQQIGVRLERVIDSKNLALQDLLSVRNFGDEELRFTLSFSFSSDFEDIFQIRGAAPGKRGKLHSPQWKDGDLCLRYDGADQVLRSLHIRFSSQVTRKNAGGAEVNLRLKPGEEKQIHISFSIIETRQATKAEPRSVTGAHLSSVSQELHKDSQEWVDQYTSCKSDNLLLSSTLSRSLRDLRILRSRLNNLEYFSAGLPWYGTLFGRDSIIAAYQTLAFDPGIAASTLRLLAKMQGKEVNEFRDEQPGKILHELRHGEMANLKEIPQTPYYGSVDSTPLFLVLVAEHANWTGDLSLFEELRENVERAFEWIDRYGDESGHGWLEYNTKSSRGLANQGWKDSGDSIVNADGSLAKAPIALVEVQGYVYLAKIKIAELYERSGEREAAARLRREAADLKKRFNQAFWLEDKGFYALALQQGTKPCAVISSNPGQALWSGIADAEKAARTVEQLMSPAMFCEWGIRTLANSERRYNPMGYHLGTIWPHDNSFLAAGFCKYGFGDRAHKLFTGILSAAQHFEHHRLPEVFCGFSKKEYEVPVRYPVACHPQAWAAGSVPFFLQSLLGLSPNALENKLFITDPVLPDAVHYVKLSGIKIAKESVEVEFERQKDGSIRSQMESWADGPRRNWAEGTEESGVRAA